MATVGIRFAATHNRVDALGEPIRMADRWDEAAPQERRRHRHPRPGRAERRRRRALTPEERALREARRRANLKLSFVAHAVCYGSFCLFLLLVAGFRAAFLVALAWGIGLVSHYFAALVAPDLRRRFVEQEVTRQVEQNVTRERRSIEDRHVRSLEELSASIAHEIRNPITAAKSLVQQMGEDPSTRESVEYAKVALEELDRVERSISHLLRFAREEDLRFEEVRLPEVVDSALATFRDRLAGMGVVVKRDVDTPSVLRGDAEKLRRVVINLVRNALDALEHGGVAEPRLEIAAGENLARTEVWLRIRDNGPGIDAETLHRIFSPFYTSRDGGTGLGLALSKKVVDAHGGSIEASSRPGDGTEFLITVPKQGGEDNGSGGRSAPAPETGETGRRDPQ